MFSIGNLYENGMGVPKDFAQAAEWYRKAAEEGDAQSCYRLGVFYEKGTGVKQDTDKAIELYRQAAELGYENAKTALKRLESKAKRWGGLFSLFKR